MLVALRPPVDAPITSGYGWRRHPVTGTRRFHHGVDYRVPVGFPIRAAAPGVVTVAGARGELGLAVVVQHHGAVETIYAHNSQLLVRPGQQVHTGQVIAHAGSTGLSTGPHLHFAIKVRGSYVDPLEAMQLGINGDSGDLNSLTVKKALAASAILVLLRLLTD